MPRITLHEVQDAAKKAHHKTQIAQPCARDVKVKNALSGFITKHSQDLTNEQLAFAYSMLGYTYTYLSMSDSASTMLWKARELMRNDFSLQTIAYSMKQNLMKNYDF